MLDEGRRRHERGQDVIVGAIQPSGCRWIAADGDNSLEVIPLTMIDDVAVIDVPAILKRHPKVCLVDGLAYDNPSSLKHKRRWEDVAELLDAGISVITSLNLQHIEEKRPRVEAITGKHVTQIVPLSFVHTADEIVVVDAPPEDCRSVSDDGDPNQPHRLTQLQLSELRELALLWPQTLWISSWKAISAGTVSFNRGARKSGSWYAFRRAPISTNARKWSAKSRSLPWRAGGRAFESAGMVAGGTQKGRIRRATGRIERGGNC